MINRRLTLNVLVIAIMVFMTVIAAIFINSSINLKKRMTYQTVQKTDLVSDLIGRSAVDVMSGGHEGAYERILSYGNVLGVEEVAIYSTDGREAFAPDGDVGGGDGPRRIAPNEAEKFLRAVATNSFTGYFSWDDQTFIRYIPLKSEGACAGCHGQADRPLGVLKVKLATGSDFDLLGYIQSLIWTLGVIIVLPVGALLVAVAIIRDKNRIYADLKENSLNLRRTYDKLNETRGYLQMILDNSRVLIITTDREGRIVEFNKEAEELLEYPKEEAVGTDVLDLYDSPEARADIATKEMKDNGIWAVRNREVVLRSKSGKRYHVILTLSTMADENGEILGTVGVGKDISEQKMLQFKLLQSEKLAGIGTLASGIAHEINNPLAGILGMAEAIRDEDDPELVKTYTEDIIQYAVNASNIVRELSAYSRSARNESRSTVDLSDIIQDSLKMARHASSFRSIELATELGGGCLVDVNSGELQQVFVNLIINAVHSMGDDGTLEISCSREGAFIKTVVSDTGGGIPEENLNQIFDPFFTTKPVGKGTGLGLYVVYRIVTKYGGSIDVESRVGEGTAFTLKFPAAVAEEAV